MPLMQHAEKILKPRLNLGFSLLNCLPCHACLIIITYYSNKIKLLMIIVTKISEKSQGILRFPRITLDFSDCLRFLCCRWISVDFCISLIFLKISHVFLRISVTDVRDFSPLRAPRTMSSCHFLQHMALVSFPDWGMKPICRWRLNYCC